MATSETEYLESPPFTSEELADFIYEKKIPALYRIADSEGTKNNDLHRFMQSAFQGGYTDTLVKSAMMKSLVNPRTCPDEFLPFLFKSWGLPYFEDIGIYYNRKFLENIGTFLRRRGTMGGTRYIIRALTGFRSLLEYERKTTSEENGRYLYVTFLLDSISELETLEVSTYTVTRFLQEHLPFYLRVINKGAVVEQEEIVWKTNAQVMSIGEVVHYDLTLGALGRTVATRRRGIVTVGTHNHYVLPR